MASSSGEGLGQPAGRRARPLARTPGQAMSCRRVVRVATSETAGRDGGEERGGADEGKRAAALSPWAGPKAALPSLAPAKVVAAV